MSNKYGKFSLALMGSCLLLAALFLPGQSSLRAESHLQGTAQPGDVVINEVAWMGTAANYNDEWMELYNTTAHAITLTGWTLQAADGTPNITLNGSISAHGYFLLERTNDTTINDIPADQIYTGDLGNTGEILTLSDDASQVIDTANGAGGAWPGGDNGTKSSMERIDPLASDTDTNWATNDGVTHNGQDANGDPLNGTPKLRNSAAASEAELITSKQGPAQIYAGQQLTYMLRLRNLGNITATNSYLTNTLPAGVTLLASSRPTSTQNGQQLIWQLGDMASGAEQVITLTTVVSEQLTGAVVNRLTAQSAATETLTANNSAAWTTTILAAQANLRVGKRGPAAATAGDTLTYYLTITNDGVAAATEVWLTDTLPAGLTFSSSDPAPTTQEGQQLIWQLGSLGAGVTQALTVTAQSTEDAIGEAANHLTATTTADESSQLDNSAVWTTTVKQLLSAGQLLIKAALYGGPAGEALQLINLKESAVDLTGWQLCKYATPLNCKALPHVELAAGATLWLADEESNFTTYFGFPPDETPATWLGLTDSGGELILQDDQETTIDVLVYGAGQTGITGWSGDAVNTYPLGLDQKFQLLHRILAESTGLPVTDTNTAADWIQNPDPATGRRGVYAGWDYETLFQPLTATETATVVVGIAPDNAIEVILQTLLRAQRTISIEVYSLSNYAVISTLVQQAEAGVAVNILLEGGLAFGSTADLKWQQELWACQQLEAVGGRCHFMIHETGDGIYNRYKYLHSKIIIVDDEWVAISSQNLTASSLPADDKSNGTYGSRGLVIATNAPSVAARAAQIFRWDCDPAHHSDILRWNTGYTSQYGSPTITPDFPQIDGVTSTVRFPQPLTVQGEFAFEFFTAPEAALRQTDALLGLVGRAGLGDRVLVEQMYEYADWGDNPVADPNLRLEAYINAARRGAEVRILVNNGTFGQEYGDQSYTATLSYVNQIASAEGLNLRAAAGDPTGYGIHNKMVLVEASGQGYAHIGSLNGSEVSSKINREAALQIQSAEVYQYLESMFWVDWNLSHPLYLPLVLRNYAPPPPPAAHLLFSEVYYIASDTNAEWVELYNPTGSTIDLSGYKIGDAANPDDYEGMYQFPTGAQIGSKGVLVIAVSGQQTPLADFELINDDPTIPEMLEVDSWGTGSWTLANGGDEVLLLGPDNQPVDVVVWGAGAYPGMTPHPGVLYPRSLERFPVDQDSDDCTVDFRERAVPDPGHVVEP
ncbi:MAG TPA: DUF11 domain-containing protein [Thermoflexia bacterium]|nr:DUF11 domain-containing protein [Thermoflexia bacterium]